MARVLLATFGSLGDLFPYIAVGRALTARGVSARIATSSDYRAYVEGAGLEFAPVAPSLAELGTPRELARKVADPLRGSAVLIKGLIMPHLRESHQQLRAAAVACELLIGHPLTFMLQVVAEEQGKPWLSSILAPASFLSREDPPAMAPVNSLQIARRLGPWVYHPLLAFIRGAVRRWERPLHDYRRELGLPDSTKVMIFEGQFSPRGTLALFDAPLMRPQPDWPPHTRLCGTPLFDGGAPDPRDLVRLKDFLAAGEPPLVFALGSSAVWLGGDFWLAALEAARQLGRRAILSPARRPAEPAGLGMRIQLPAVLAGFPACLRGGAPGGDRHPVTGAARRSAAAHHPVSGSISRTMRRAAVRLGVARTAALPARQAARLVQQLRPLLNTATYAAAAQDLARGACSPSTAQQPRQPASSRPCA